MQILRNDNFPRLHRLDICFRFNHRICAERVTRHFRLRHCRRRNDGDYQNHHYFFIFCSPCFCIFESGYLLFADWRKLRGDFRPTSFSLYKCSDSFVFPAGALPVCLEFARHGKCRYRRISEKMNVNVVNFDRLILESAGFQRG